jgi:prephenate dehydrogenase
VIDIGSTKADVVREMQKLPPRFDPLGGHPMCGKEKLSIENAEASLFLNAIFAFTPSENTSENAQQIAEQIAQSIGANPLWIDAETHDRWTAATSHFPYIAASALALSTPTAAAPLAGPGFRSTTRLAATPASLMLDILATNRINILEALDQFRQQIDQMRTLLEANEFEHLQNLLESGVHQREQIISGSNRIEPS